MTTKKKNGPLIAILATVAIAVMAGTMYYDSHKTKKQIRASYDIPSSVKIDGTILDKARSITAFSLTNSQGKPFTEQSLQGHWSMVFFGFTNCGYVCPTSLAAMNQMYTKLQKDLPKDQLPQVYFVSVDPERDTLNRIDQYVSKFNHHFIGARGTLAETRALAKQMSAVFVKVQLQGGDKNQYIVNHSANVMLVDPAGNLRAFFSFPHTGSQMVVDYENILRSEHQHAYL